MDEDSESPSNDIELENKIVMDNSLNKIPFKDNNSFKLYSLTKRYIEEECNRKKIQFNSIVDELSVGSLSTNTSVNDIKVRNLQSKLCSVKKNLIAVVRENQITKRKKYILNSTTIDQILKQMLALSIYENDEYWLTYEKYVQLRDSLENDIGKMYLPYWVYINLYQGHPNGYISTFLLFNYIKKFAFANQTRYLLSRYDNGEGFIKNTDFHIFMMHYIQGFKILFEQLTEKYIPFYVCNITTWFYFFLDPLHIGKMEINKIVTSGFIELLNENNIIHTSSNSHRLNSGDEDSIESSHQIDNVPWFSLSQMTQIYNFYLFLDDDANGMISKHELKKFKNGIFTEAFISQLFINIKTFQGQIDYKSFIQFIIAYNNSHTPQAVYFFFKLLDVNHDGYINIYDINYFYRDIHKQLIQSSNELNVSLEQITSEIFDMVKPIESDRFTVKELIQCNQGSVIINMLISTDGFLNYEFKNIS